MFAIEIIIHALKMLFDDLWATINLTVFPFLIGVALIVSVAVFALGVPLSDLIQMRMGMSQLIGAKWLAIPLAAAIFAVTFCWVAVGWHRFVLLKEYPGGVLPPFRGAQALAYFRETLRLILLGALVFLPLSIPVLGWAWWELNEGLGVLLLMMAILGLSALAMRFALVLPAAAIGHEVTLRQSWDATGGYFWTFVALLFAGAVVDYLSDSLIAPGPVGFALMAFFNWLFLVLNLSILSTLYGFMIMGWETKGSGEVHSSDDPQ